MSDNTYCTGICIEYEISDITVKSSNVQMVLETDWCFEEINKWTCRLNKIIECNIQ